MSLDLDLSSIPESTGFQVLPPSTYFLIVDEAESKDTKAGDGSYINVKFKVLEGQYKDRFVWHMFNYRNKNTKAVEIGLSQIKSFLRCAGSQTDKLENVLDLIGLRCDAVVKTRVDADYGDKAVISFFKPHAAKGEDPNKETVPF